jgi:hypothetical protein
LAWPGGTAFGASRIGAGASSGTGAGVAWTFGCAFAGGTALGSGAGCTGLTGFGG